MADSREEAVKLRTSAKRICTSRRKLTNDAFDKNEDKDLMHVRAESFLEGLAKLRLTCEGVLAFDEESGGEDELADQGYIEKVESDNYESEKKCQKFLKDVKDDKKKMKGIRNI